MMSIKYNIGELGMRPWGTWRVVHIAPYHVVKHIIVNVGGQLSLQYHNHRDEVWAITNGAGNVTLGDTIIVVGPGDGVVIKKLVHHRIENTGDIPLEFIETQIGDILDENDIVRIYDPYQR